MNREITSKIEDGLYYMQNDTLKAIEIFDEVLGIEPENIDALNGKGSSLLKLNRMNEAEKYFDYSLSISQNSSALINKGRICKSKKQYLKALKYYDKANLINPSLNNIVTMFKNEVIELIDGNIEIELNDFSPEANELIKRGIEYKNSNKLWDALDCLQNAMKADRSCVNFAISIINEIKSILQNELLIKTPDFGDSRNEQFKRKSLRLLLFEEDPEQALTIMNLILEDNENEIDTLNHKGCVLFLFDKFDDAIECFDKCLRLDENYYYALFNKAIVLRRLNLLDESLDCFDELLKTPKNYNKVKPYQLEILDKLHEGALT
jgi:tetratricopeptide (TPR) repeat protein